MTQFKFSSIQNKQLRRISIAVFLAAILLLVPIVIFIAFLIFLGDLVKENLPTFTQEVKDTWDDLLNFIENILDKNWHHIK